MPWTFAHPAAVLPLHRLGTVRLNLAALVIGSLTPDFGYYGVRLPRESSIAHSFVGSITLVPLVGLLLLACFYLLRRPVCYMLPQPHREALLPLARTSWRFGAAEIVVIIASLVLGGWTHILWDSFTHIDRWFVNSIPWLQLTAFTVFGHTVYSYSLLQYLSSLVGVAILVWFYARWLRAAHGDRPWQFFAREDAWRYGCIGGAIALGLLLSIPAALQEALEPSGLFGLRTFIVNSLVGTTSIFVASFVATSLICYWSRQRQGYQ